MSLSNEEVLKAFGNDYESAVPFSVWHHFNPDEHVEAREDPTIFKNDVAKEPQFVDAVDPDFIKLMDDGYFTYQFQNVSDPNDLASLKKITEISTDHPWLVDQKQLFEDQLSSLNQNKVILSNVFSAVSLFKWSLVRGLPSTELALGDKRFADLYTKDPDTVIHALRVINQDIKKQIEVGHQAGVNGVFFSTQEIQDDRIDEHFFEKVQKPLDAELIETINQDFDIGVLHICGFDGATNHLPWFVDYSLPVVNWATKVDGYTLGEGKQLFKDKVVFGGLGNTTNDVLFSGTQAEIQSAVDRVLDESGTTGVIIGSDCTVPRKTPVENIRWAAEAAHTYQDRKQND
ncbi:uroporphyrinogen decarboxylase family protein [Lactobacillus sp. Sy-1]|uniref:uroporphyrinogen decarboxylase family protein n=1 Tax=Lactobacillus sp. Sy-1 TaxID=2109645 RepID=UPI001C5BF4D5|nr:uroporphyrinogen decarboxylase family protein [Lactobacillus sp. Sy-1]MBW1606254.1 uroporphyrinogen decarboxylase [Lactobacillus sp. Sy-1]